MYEPRRGYVAYLLRLWQVRQGKGWSWRASLQGARTGERLGFTTLEDLFDFVREQSLSGSDLEQDSETNENARIAGRGDAS